MCPIIEKKRPSAKDAAAEISAIFGFEEKFKDNGIEYLEYAWGLQKFFLLGISLEASC